MAFDGYDVSNIENVGPHPQPVPVFVGRENEYQELNLLGRGAYGKVFLVRNRFTNQQYALKRIQVPVGRDGVPQSVLREISTMKTFLDLDHNNVLKLHDVFHNIIATNRRQDLVVNMVVERCDWDLWYFLKKLPSDMPETQIKMMTRQIFNGIDYLHSMNVIHRDIKPQNILVNKDLTIKLADFGLSRGFGLSSSFTTVVVTLWYRSPELLLQSTYNSAIDIWSAGCIVSELFLRNPLFPGSTEAQQLSMIFQKLGTPKAADWPPNAVIDRNFYPSYPAQSFERLNPRMSPEAINLVKRCLAFDPIKRCTAAEALQDPFFFSRRTISTISS